MVCTVNVLLPDCAFLCPMINDPWGSLQFWEVTAYYTTLKSLCSFGYTAHMN